MRRRHTSTAVLGLVAILIVSLAACSGKTDRKTSDGLQTVTLEIPNPGATFLPFYLGREEGIYKKYGINLKIVTNLSPPLATQAILGGTLDMMTAIGTAGSAGLNGQPMRVYDVMADQIDFVMIGAKGITKMSQLAGKTVVGESATSQTNLMETLMLQHSHVSPSSVKFINITGGDAARAALVEAGKAQGVSVEITGALTLERKGLKAIGNTSFVVQPFTGIATSQAFVKAHGPLMTKMLKASLEATTVVRTQEAKGEAVLEAAPFKLSPTDAKTVWKYVQPTWTTKGQPSATAVDNQLSAWQTQYKLKSKPQKSDAFDFSLLPAALKDS